MADISLVITKNIKTDVIYCFGKPDRREKDVSRASFIVYDYRHLMLIISDLMKLCVYATEDEFCLNSSSVVSSKINIAQILEIAIELLPIYEAKFLDKSRELFLKKKTE